MNQKKISILGSTGSIGTSTLDVVRQNPSRFSVVAMAAGRNIDLFVQQLKEFQPQCVSVETEADAHLLQQNFPKLKIYSGSKGLIEVALASEAEVLVSALVGARGLLPTLSAIEAKKDIALANKEVMVIAGQLMNEKAKQNGVKILPVDSEHSAIFQALQGNEKDEVRKIILTASGGPFRGKSLQDLQQVTLAEALKHPNWSMGKKITIDSATLMNKGLELIEARWLFDIPEHLIEILVHPQSIIHSMVEYHDGSVMAQLGIPDMRIPIAYALSYPHRLKNQLPSLDLLKIKTLDFYQPDTATFKCLALARKALKLEGAASCVLNAANEVAVDLFLNEKIKFVEIPEIVNAVLEAGKDKASATLEDLLAADVWARETARECLE